MKKRMIRVFCLLAAVLLTGCAAGAEVFTPKEVTPDAVRLAVPGLCQYPDLPTGCEATAAAMVLQYHGVEVTPQAFARDWLSCDPDFSERAGRIYGPDPCAVFAGDPFSQYAYGCFAPVITEAVNRHATGMIARTVIGQTLEKLCRKYLDRGLPLLIWATGGMKEPRQGNQWILPDGTTYTWIAGEHCLVLTGYDAQGYFFNDPMTGNEVWYPRTLTEERYAALGSQAVCIRPSVIP